MGFRVQVQVFVNQLCESSLRAQGRTLCVALADWVLAARDLGFVLERFGGSFHDAEVRESPQRIATHRAVDPSFPHEALRAVAGHPKPEAGNLVVAQEKLAAPGWPSLFDQVLGEVRHVGPM